MSAFLFTFFGSFLSCFSMDFSAFFTIVLLCECKPVARTIVAQTLYDVHTQAKRERQKKRVRTKRKSRLCDFSFSCEIHRVDPSRKIYIFFFVDRWNIFIFTPRCTLHSSTEGHYLYTRRKSSIVMEPRILFSSFVYEITIS